jgi:hypothetical protein
MEATMKAYSGILALTVLATASTGALAQGMTSQQPMGSPSMTAPAPAAQGGMREYRLPPGVQAELKQRGGREQRQQELVQTTLLNQFGQLGFSELRSMSKEGTNYVAQVTTTTGEPATVVIDPNAGVMRTQVAADRAAPMSGSVGTSGAAGAAVGSGATLDRTTMQPPANQAPLNQPTSQPMTRGTSGAGTVATPELGSGSSIGGDAGRTINQGRQDSTLNAPGSRPSPMTGQGQSTMGDRTGTGTR